MFITMTRTINSWYVLKKSTTTKAVWTETWKISRSRFSTNMITSWIFLITPSRFKKIGVPLFIFWELFTNSQKNLWNKLSSIENWLLSLWTRTTITMMILFITPSQRNLLTYFITKSVPTQSFKKIIPSMVTSTPAQFLEPIKEISKF